jgi:NADH-quinone oxidoreductase subunit H
VTDLQFDLLQAFVMAAIVIGALQGAVPVLVWVERRGGALIQDRLGPNRVGWFGVLQPFADALKFFFKEDIIPANADKFLYVLAPALGFLPALSTFCVIPFGPSFDVPFLGVSRTVHLQVAHGLDAGVLVLLGLVGMGVYGIVLAGWSSNNKYSLMGGIRSSAQIISYELAMALAIVAAVIPASSLKLEEVVAWQGAHPWLILTQPIGFVVFFIAAFAETNRLPFDLPEAEAELVAGYHTEYSSMKFALFFMSEYANMVTSCAMTTTLFLGGWTLPFVNIGKLAMERPWIGVPLGLAVFLGKLAFLLWIFIWVRWTLPRYRYDQLMRLGWKVLLPFAALNLLWAAFATAMRWF